MSGIFISYRRDDGGYGRAIYEYLSNWFDESHIFFDSENIGSGQIFMEEITKSLQNCSVVLAVIGPHWLSERNRVRLHQPDDPTRTELRIAFASNRKIIPVLCGGANMPNTADLPPDIASVSYHNAHPLPDCHYRPALTKLLDLLKSLGLMPRFRPPHGVIQAFHTAGYTLSNYYSDPLDNLSALHRAFQKHEQVLVSSAATVHGMGGVGKTQLALKYSHDFRDEYAGVWWFRAAALAQLQIDCQQFCERQGVTVWAGEEPHTAVKRWLQIQSRWLLVYDNAELGYGEENQKLTSYLPGGEHHILITARGGGWEELARPIRLDVWDNEQSLDFLRKRLKNSGDEERQTLADALGGLPLALEQACAYLHKTGLSVASYCHALNDWEKGAELLNRKDSFTDYPRSVLATLSLAFEKLSEGAKQLLRLCGWFAPEPIPEALLFAPVDFINKKIEQNQDEKNAWAASILPNQLQKALVDEIEFREIVAELISYALVEVVELNVTPNGVTEYAKQPALLLHRLTQEAIKKRLSNPESDCQCVVQLLYAVFPYVTYLPESWPECRVLFPHVRRMDAYFPKGWVERDLYISLLLRAGGYLRHGLSLYGEAVDLLQRAVELSCSFHGENHEITLCCMNDLAEILREQGVYSRAFTIHEEVLKTRLRLLGREHHLTLTSINNLALTYTGMGKFLPARRLQEQVVDIRSRMLGVENRSTLISMGNLALTLWHQGELKEARALEEKALDVSMRVLGATDPYSLKLMNNLAGTLYSLGDINGAGNLYRQGLESCGRVLGENHPDTLKSMSGLALIHEVQGDLRGAEVLNEKVLRIRRSVLGDMHPDTIEAMCCLAGKYLLLAKHQDSTALLKEALSHCRQTFGIEHPMTLTVMENLAKVFREQADYANARALQEQVLDISDKCHGEDHPDTIKAMISLACTLSHQKDFLTAQALEEKALLLSKKSLGVQHKLSWTIMRQLALRLEQQEKFLESQDLLEILLQIITKTVGEEDIEALDTMDQLATCLYAQKDFRKVRPLQEKILKTRRRLLGEEHVDTLAARKALAKTLHAQGDICGARALEEKILSVQQRVLGREHPETIASLSTLANTLFTVGDLAGARKLQEATLELCRRAFGQKDKRTSIAAYNLLCTLVRLKASSEARSLIRNDLEWLLKCETCVLSADHRKIKQQLVRLM